MPFLPLRISAPILGECMPTASYDVEPIHTKRITNNMKTLLPTALFTGCKVSIEHILEDHYPFFTSALYNFASQHLDFLTTGGVGICLCLEDHRDIKKINI